MRHETPSDLDEFMEREEIQPEEYADFWGGYWSAKDKQAYLNSWKLDPAEDLEGFEVPKEAEGGESAFASFWRWVSS